MATTTNQTSSRTKTIDASLSTRIGILLFVLMIVAMLATGCASTAKSIETALVSTAYPQVVATEYAPASDAMIALDDAYAMAMRGDLACDTGDEACYQLLTILSHKLVKR